MITHEPSSCSFVRLFRDIMATSSVLISCAVLALLTARCLCIRDSGNCVVFVDPALVLILVDFFWFDCWKTRKENKRGVILLSGLFSSLLFFFSWACHTVDLRTNQKGVVEKPGAGIISLGRHLLDGK